MDLFLLPYSSFCRQFIAIPPELDYSFFKLIFVQSSVRQA